MLHFEMTAGASLDPFNMSMRLKMPEELFDNHVTEYTHK